MTACNIMGYDAIGGQFGDPTNQSRAWGNNTGTSGWVRNNEPAANAIAVNGGLSQNCWPLPIGNTHLKGGVGTTGDPQATLINSYRGYVDRLASCPARFSGNGVGSSSIASQVSTDAYGGLALAAETTDTNLNGVTSAGGTNGGAPNFNHSPTCANVNLGISALQRIINPAVPNSALWTDDMRCFNPPLAAGVTPPTGAFATEHISQATTLGQTSVNVLQDVSGVVRQQSPGGGSNLFNSLPIDVQADLLGSIDTETDVFLAADGDQRIQFHVTGIRLYGAAYSPRDVRFSMNTAGRHLFEVFTGPGGRLMAAWAADQIERFLDAGGTSWSQMRASVTINDTAVVPIGDGINGPGYVASVYRSPDRALVNQLRRMATAR